MSDCQFCAALQMRCHACWDAELAALRERVATLEKERDAAEQAQIDALVREQAIADNAVDQIKRADLAERATVEAIAAWLDEAVHE